MIKSHNWLNTPAKYRNYLPNLLIFLGLNGKGVEVGVNKGEYSEIILCNSNLKVLFSVDAWRYFSKEEYDDVANISQAQHDKNKLETEECLNKFGDRSVILNMTSKEASKSFKDNELDFAYIDANHLYEKVKEDIELWYPKVKVGGVFGGHDYINDGKYLEGVFGVKGAVDEFIEKEKQKLFITEESWKSWYIIKQ